MYKRATSLYTTRYNKEDRPHIDVHFYGSITVLLPACDNLRSLIWYYLIKYIRVSVQNTSQYENYEEKNYMYISPSSASL